MKKVLNTSFFFSLKNANLLLIFAIFFMGFSLVNTANAQNYDLVKSGPKVANPGDTIKYIIAVKVNGTNTSDLIITDYLPSGNQATYISSSPAGTYNEKANTLQWNKFNNNDLNNFSNKEIYLVVKVVAGKISNNGGFKVTEPVTRLETHAALTGLSTDQTVKSNVVVTEIPSAGGAVLPVE